jgi:hypothetical protein
MTNYDKLIEKLKENEEIKKDLEWCKFWTNIEYIVWVWHTRVWQFVSMNYRTNEILVKSKNFIPRRIYRNDIISFNNQLEERHLRMYCKIKKIKFDIKQFVWEDEIFINTDRVVKLDNTKPFHLQDDKVYWEILNYINNN